MALISVFNAKKKLFTHVKYFAIYVFAVLLLEEGSVSASATSELATTTQMSGNTISPQ